MKKVKFFRLVWEKSEIGDESIVLKEGVGGGISLLIKNCWKKLLPIKKKIIHDLKETEKNHAPENYRLPS